MTEVTLRWLLWRALCLAEWLLTRSLLWPMRLLAWLDEAKEDAQIEWLLANTDRRLKARKRLELVAQVKPLPGTVPATLGSPGNDRG